jgi:hypothetical protein
METTPYYFRQQHSWFIDISDVLEFLTKYCRFCINMSSVNEGRNEIGFNNSGGMCLMENWVEEVSCTLMAWSASQSWQVMKWSAMGPSCCHMLVHGIYAVHIHRMCTQYTCTVHCFWEISQTIVSNCLNTVVSHVSVESLISDQTWLKLNFSEKLSLSRLPCIPCSLIIYTIYSISISNKCK